MSKQTNRRAAPTAFILAAVSGFTLAATSAYAETDSFYGFSAPQQAQAQHKQAAPNKGPQGQAYYGGPLAQAYGAPHSAASTAGYPAYAQQGYGAPAHGFPAQVYGAPTGYGVPTPASVYGQPPQGYGQPGAPVYGQPAQGYPAPYGYPAPAPFGYPDFGSSLFAPAEPIYAPAERFGGSTATAPAERAPAEAPQVTVAPASSAAAPAGNYIEIPSAQAYTNATAPAPSAGYSVAAPSSEAATYVGPSQQIAPASSYETTDPYSVILQQETAAPQQPVYEPYKPSYEQYQAPAVQAPAAQPVQQYETYQQTVIETAPAGYEFGAVAAPAAPVALAPQPTYAPSHSGGHFVQVGSFRTPVRAERLVAMLAAAGEQAFIMPAVVRGKQYYRVRVAAGDNKRDASYVRDRIRNLGHYEAQVVKG